MIRAVLLGALLGACWRAAPPPPEIVSSPLLDEAKAPVVPRRSSWVGFYQCAQGRTAVTLTIVMRTGDSARALFEFGPHEGNRDIPHGRYKLTGTFREAEDGRLELTLQPHAWVEQPPGYSMTAIAARSDEARTRLVGSILSESCGEIVIERLR